MKSRHLAIALSCAVTALGTPLVAQTQCAPRDAVVSGLQTKYGETRHAIGLSARNAVLEVFASESSGSWTIIVTDVRGISCLVASGGAFEQIAETPKSPAKGT